MTSGTKNTSTEYREVGDTGNTDRRAGLESRPRAIPRGDDFPVLSRTLVDSLTSMPDDDPSLTRLANDVMREYTLTVPWAFYSPDG